MEDKNIQQKLYIYICMEDMLFHIELIQNTLENNIIIRNSIIILEFHSIYGYDYMKLMESFEMDVWNGNYIMFKVLCHKSY